MAVNVTMEVEHLGCTPVAHMTLRQHFAALAMHSMLVEKIDELQVQSAVKERGKPFFQVVADDAVRLADALIAELNKEQSP